MNVKEATELLNKPMEANYLVITFNYGIEIVLPHKQGLEVINSLSVAEKITGYGDAEQVKPLIANDLSIKLISAEHYRECKMRYYLAGNPDEEDKA